MRTRPVASTGLEVTELGLGTAAIGNLYRAVDDDTARAAIDTAWQAGIRYFDTAPHYGLGLAERRLGDALALRPRQEFVVSTKVGRLLLPNPHPTGSDLPAAMFDVPDELTRVQDFTADGVRRSLDASLTRLGMDHIDIVLVHDPDDAVESVISGALPALLKLRDQGVVGAVGVGMNQWQAPLRFVLESDVDVVMLAGRWTLLDRSGGPLLAACADRGVSVLAAAPFNSGLLASARPADDARYGYAAASPQLREHVTRLAEIAEAHDSSVPALALQFPLRDSAVSAVVVGLRSPGEVCSAAQSYSSPITAATWSAIEGINVVV